MAWRGLRPYSVSCQNEPQHSDPSYPTMLLPVMQEAQVGKVLRSLLDSYGYNDVKIIGYEHNWDNAGTYPVQLVGSHETQRKLLTSPRWSKLARRSQALGSIAMQAKHRHNWSSQVLILTRRSISRNVRELLIQTGGRTSNGTCIGCTPSCPFSRVLLKIEQFRR